VGIRVRHFRVRCCDGAGPAQTTKWNPASRLMMPANHESDSDDDAKFKLKLVEHDDSDIMPVGCQYTTISGLAGT
jgi:hypothetical protein